MSSLDTLIQKLAGAPSSVSASDSTEGEVPVVDRVELIDPVYVEKLASAVDFIMDNWSGEEEVLATESDTDPTETKEAAAEVVAPVQNQAPPEETVSAMSDLLRNKLQARMSEKTAAAEQETNQNNKDVAEAILGKLLQLKSSADVATDLGDSDKTAQPLEDEAALEESFSVEENIYSDSNNSDVSNDADGDAAIKAASAGQSLADVLNAALGTDEQSVESASEESAKTAGVRGSEESTKTRKAATQVLKTKLMAKVGEEAQS
tara:strand:- start:3892 stop:4680 length:789 start_codon:yes stop_codon:yes gene_type:complete